MRRLPRRAGLCLPWGALVLLLVATASTDAQSDTGGIVGVERNAFVPTNEWQVIPEGVSVPQGLHIRMDLSTGVKMAKLLEKEEDTAKANATQQANAHQIAVRPSEEGADGEVPGGAAGEQEEVDAGRRTMEKVLHNLPDGEKEKMGIDLVKAKAELPSEEYWSHVQKLWDERQEVIQRVYEQMVKPDELLTGLIGSLKDADKLPLDELNHALMQLEDHLTDIDMARDFRTLGGWSHLVDMLHGRHHETVRANAAWVIGNAVKNDPGFQLWAVEGVKSAVEEAEASALARLLGMLVEEAGSGGGSEPHLVDDRRRKAVYAITSATRNNDYVRGELLRAGGLEALAGLLSSEQASSRGLRIKVATFVHDLLVEVAQHAERHYHEGPVHSAIQDAGALWCRGVEALLQDAASHPRELERAVEAALSLAPHCPAGTFQEAAQKAHGAWEDEAKAIDSEYRQELLAAIRRLIGEEQQQQQEEEQQGTVQPGEVVVEAGAKQEL